MPVLVSLANVSDGDPALPSVAYNGPVMVRVDESMTSGIVAEDAEL